MYAGIRLCPYAATVGDCRVVLRTPRNDSIRVTASEYVIPEGRSPIRDLRSASSVL